METQDVMVGSEGGAQWTHLQVPSPSRSEVGWAVDTLTVSQSLTIEREPLTSS